MDEGKGIDHQSVVDLMTGAIGRLKQEHNLQTSAPMKEDIESLETQLRTIMDAALRKMQQDQLDPQGDKHCAYELRELSYDIEDIIDNLLLSIDDGSDPITNQDSFREALEDIKVQVKNLDAWRAGNFVPTTTSTVVDPCLEDGFIQARQLVGIHKLKADLISTISSSSQRLKIVSIWGAGGMGKTTLAKSVYENVKGNFQYTVFVSVGPQPDTKKALRDILIHFGKKKYSDLNMIMLDEGQLVVELQQFLKNKRFLIVIDDIRNISSWEVIKLALVDNGCGSRIITTSRILSVAESSGEVLKLTPLPIDGSKELFYATLCGRKGTINFDQLDEQATEYILQKCGCVPLAIIMLASLLAGKPQEEWTEVYNSIGFDHEDNIGVENTEKIIQFSYYDLPSHLKTCLLYLSIFAENQVIEKDMLVWRWVAEGFERDEEQGGSLFKVGERYLYDLISRSMMQIVENEDTNNIRACRVEGMVLDWIRTAAEEENFVNASDSCDHDDDGHLFFQSNARIMAVHNRALDNPYDLAGMWKPKVRSFNGTGCSICGTTSLLDPDFQALRVLSLEGCTLTLHGSYLMENNLIIPGAGFHHLRYLGLAGTRIQDMRIEIGHLRYLQTLDLTDTYIRALPPSVTQLRKLKCLRCLTSKTLELPQGMGNLTSLEELRLGRVGTVFQQSTNFAKELSKLTELRVVRIHTGYLLDERVSEALVESLSKLQKIEVLELLNKGGTFSFDLLMDNDGPIRSPRAYHVIVTGSFPKLRYMKMNTWLMSQPGAMPQLKSVDLVVHVGCLKGAFDFYKLRYLRLLEKVDVGINCEKAKMEDADEAEATLRRVVESHPNRPKLIVGRSDQCIDDKQIRFLGLHSSPVSPEVLPLELLRKITNDFSEKQRLGNGTFGTVYKGFLDGKEVAVKLLHSMSQRLNYEEEFMKEFENLRRLCHPNIVKLLGYCYEIKCVCVEYEGRSILADKIYRALCFDYMHNGSLQGHLDDESRGLDWRTRYKIIKGTCDGLKYLHEGLGNPMFHLDLKPGNILLDRNMVPKLADFGLSKLVSDNQTQVTSNFLGTIRYCTPEHIERSFFSNKFDIFSLGVVMIEIIAGPEGYCKAVEMTSQEFIDQVQENWRKRMHQATSGCTSPKYECHQVKKCIEIALECVHPERMQRPDIQDIISRLKKTENRN